MIRTATALACLLACIGPPVQADTFPSRPITIAIPFQPGATSDVFTRLYTEIVGPALGQRFVLEFKPGAGGAIAAMAVKQARPDGHTLFLGNISSQSTLPWTAPSLPYDPVKDFAPITLLWSFPSFLTVHESVPAKSVAELVALARQSTKGLNYGSQGVAATGHIIAAMFQNAIGAPLVHIPYKGGGPAIVALASGEVDLVFTPYATIAEHVRSGKVRVLAAATRERWSGLPDVPTMAESGYPGVEIDTWFGLFAPAGTPQPVIDTLHAGFAKAAQDPVLVKRLTDQAVEVKTTTPTELAALAASDSARLGKVIDANNIKTE